MSQNVTLFQICGTKLRLPFMFLDPLGTALSSAFDDFPPKSRLETTEHVVACLDVAPRMYRTSVCVAHGAAGEGPSMLSAAPAGRG